MPPAEADPCARLVFQGAGHRRGLAGSVRGFPEFSNLGYDNFTRAGDLGRHAHVGRFEFCLILRGRVTWWAKDRVYDLRGGDVFFTWPDEPHGGQHEIMHPCAIYWLTLRVPRPADRDVRGYLRLPPAEARALCAAVHALKDRHLRGARLLEPYYAALFRHLERRTYLGVTQARAALQGMLATLVTLPPAGAPLGFIPPGIVRAKEFLEGCPRPWPTVAELADVAGMSVSHFHATFVERIGMAPMEFAHRARLERARKLLAAPRARVIGVALGLGYCSSQHLSACFRRYLRETPRGQPAKR